MASKMDDSRHSCGLWSGPLAVVVASVAMVLASDARAEGGEWVVRAETLYMEAHGHDQHVMTIHETDAAMGTDTKSAVLTDVDSGNAFRVGAEYVTESWRWGLEAWGFYTKQSVDDRDAAASGPGQTLVFEVPDRVFTSSSPGETLYYRFLEDNDLETWTVDVYGIRRVVETDTASLGIQFGVRLGDFDNDYHAAIGVAGSGGVQIDASSNYDRMTGPLVGFAGSARLGRSSIRAAVRQSVLLGSVALSSSTRDYVGEFSLSPAFVSHESFRTTEDVAIPVSDLQLEWTWPLGRHFTFGAAVSGSVWWDLPIPPGTGPGEGANELLNENTIVYVGVAATIRYTF